LADTVRYSSAVNNWLTNDKASEESGLQLQLQDLNTLQWTRRTVCSITRWTAMVNFCSTI